MQERLQKRLALTALGIAALVLVYFWLPGRETEDFATLQPARGTVLYEGRPLPTAAILLHPVGGKRDVPRPQALSRDDGTFVLTTYRPDDGAPPGDYQVTVVYYEKQDPSDESKPRNLLPPRYARPETSGLAVRIGEGENQLPPLRLQR